ncbi:HEPN domain-containing protein [Microbacterium ureisolvens]|uniref:RiboL-PSP-HEPN domain-containing protein n=1 Tax=Microbacterium ureisolvens TaxID=2781186 RepID=A0ABS7I0N1_9MICO|nr:HEPN domain-containing protein [Microbacterium ureisolvens]MBW9110659.1 hypothetical protein [Microbacterium ureisolvens]
MVWPGAWPSHELSSSRSRLEELRVEVEGIDADASNETEQGMTRFLVVRACGHIEFTFDEAFCAFAESKSSPHVASFVRTQFFRGANPSPDRIGQTLRRLEAVRADRFDALIDADDQRLRRELSFLVDRRNKIAHGQSETVRRRKALDLADVALELGDWIVAELDPR